MPTLSTTQSRRQAIASLLRENLVAQQAHLVDLLRKNGFEVTQSSVSRDLRDIGVAKVGDRYVMPSTGSESPADMFAALAPFVQNVHVAGPNLTVIKTRVGSAQSVAQAIDSANWPEEVGTVAGDDTIFVATKDQKSQLILIAHLQDVFGLLYPENIEEHI